MLDPPVPQALRPDDAPPPPPAPRTADDTQDLRDVVEEIDTLCEEADDLDVQTLLDHYDGRAYGLWILIPGLFALSPVGAVPAVPSIVALTIIFITLQALLGRDKPWLPNWIRRLPLSESAIHKLSRFARPFASGIDRVLRPRLLVLVSGPAQWIVAVGIMALATLMIPLELVPMAGFLPCGAIVLLALALFARDGLLVLLAAVLAAATLSTVVVVVCRLLV